MYLSLDMANYPLDRLPVTPILINRLIALRVKHLMLSSRQREIDEATVRDMRHNVVTELSWGCGAVDDDYHFAITATGFTTDEAVENAIKDFYNFLEQDPEDSLNVFKET